MVQEKKILLRNIKEISQNVDFLRKTNQTDKESYEKEVNKLKNDMDLLKRKPNPAQTTIILKGYT